MKDFYSTPLELIEDVDVQIVEMAEGNLAQQVTQPAHDEVLHLELLFLLRMLGPDHLADLPAAKYWEHFSHSQPGTSPHYVSCEPVRTLPKFEDNLQGVLSHGHVVIVLLQLNTFTKC